MTASSARHEGSHTELFDLIRVVMRTVFNPTFNLIGGPYAVANDVECNTFRPKLAIRNKS